MRLAICWNVQFLLGALHFFLNLHLINSETKAFIRHHHENRPPVFLTDSINVTVKEGDLAILPCSVKDLGTRQVAWRRLSDGLVMTVGHITWMKDKRVSVENKYHHEKPGHSTWNLLMKSVRKKDSGMYECQITAKKKHSLNITLVVTGPPLRQPKITINGTRFPNLGEQVRLMCNATGRHGRIPEDIDWFKEGDKIDGHKYPGILITKFRSLKHKTLVSQLIIDHSAVADNGMYICRSSDEEIDSLKVTVMVADTKNTKRVPRPVDGKSHSTQYGARYRSGSENDRTPVDSAASCLLLKGSSWIALFFSIFLYPLSLHVI